jgi:beta-galactosidase
MNAGFFTNSIADFEDIVGVNYNATSYDRIHKRRPNKPMFGSEDTNQKTTRGEYADDRDKAMSSAYNLSAAEWLDVANRPYMCGSFTWTGFDYRGEPNPFGWPDVSNNTGLVDLCGNPKDKFYYFQSCWTTTPMVHLLPDSWNWPGLKGKRVRVIAFSNAKKVELFLNDRSLGAVDVEYDSYAQWQVPFEPGHLVAKAYINGKTVATEDLSTTGAPSAIQAQPFGATLAANDEDIAVIPITILDDGGRVVPDSTNEVTCQLLGGGRIVGLGNGDPADHTPEHVNRKQVFHGRCDVYVQAGNSPAVYQLIVKSPGLATAGVSIRVE